MSAGRPSNRPHRKNIAALACRSSVSDTVMMNETVTAALAEATRCDFGDRGAEIATRLAGTQLLRRGPRANRWQADVPCSWHVPLSEWHNPHGVRVQLHARRRCGALQA